MTRRHLVLVGLPGAGKSAVGRLVAKALGTQFVDVDDLVVEEAGLSVSQVFVQRGEKTFRAMERAAVERVMGGEPCVVAPGGGWAAQEGNLAAVAGRALTIYLETDVESAAARTRAEAPLRPLLEGDDHRAALASLLGEREGYYTACELTVTTRGKTVEAVARDVEALARREAGW